MNQFLLVLCGLPASGKTTLAKAVYEIASVSSKTRLVSTDTWRDEEYYEIFTPEKENAVRKKALKHTQESLDKGESVIHDDTNYYSSMRHELYSIANSVQCRFGVVYVKTPLDVVLKWNEKRGNAIPVEVIRRINSRLDIPGIKYAWDKPIYQVDLSSNDVIDAAEQIMEIMNMVDPIIDEPKTQKGIGEKYDRITRKTVSEFLIQHPDLRRNLEVSQIRRRISSIAIKDEMTLEETRVVLLRELEKLVSGQS